MSRGLYAGKILAPNLTSDTIMALQSRTSLSNYAIPSDVQITLDALLHGKIARDKIFDFEDLFL